MKRIFIIFACVISYAAGLSFGLATTAASRHVKLGEPQRILFRADREAYAVQFDTIRHTTDWVSYHITPEELLVGYDKRPAFAADRNLPEECRASPTDYVRTGWQRGHLKPFRDSNQTPQTRRESMLLTNVVPQAPKLNAGVWAKLEKEIRDRAMVADESVIITGALVGWELCDIQDTTIAIPGALWKACAFRHGDKWQVKCWYSANYDGAQVRERPLHDIRRISGFELFPVLRGVQLETDDQ